LFTSFVYFLGERKWHNLNITKNNIFDILNIRVDFLPVDVAELTPIRHCEARNLAKYHAKFTSIFKILLKCLLYCGQLMHAVLAFVLCDIMRHNILMFYCSFKLEEVAVLRCIATWRSPDAAPVFLVCFWLNLYCDYT